ncbi:SDR family NAD(P)-dependent oxidoreductase [Actinomadura sp. 7K507]|uniref:SDR family NAD(P)-dependent oxidoreductase n=1 Tax=Actinomadura sp. 7K507 TaxID=2530365 RepID=UPI00104B8A96|nr:SDR family NAD(P)-dependent oxidoreductase [Actinomadura sp. 7K507]TDC81755.1 SDR family NAD(P)-dependent oxidoreductase [Actinomadura sp. 7K507]
MPDQPSKTVIISGGTTGMGRAVALAQLARGNHVTVIGSNEARGRALVDQAADPNLRFLRADLSSIAEVERVVAHVHEHHQAVDALALFANRISPKREATPDGLEFTFALYYLSRYLLGHRLLPLLDAAPNPVVINVAGVGNTAGRIFWDDPQLTRRYSQVRAQLQAGRANDLLGVAFAGQVESKVRYVLYHPGFTRSGADAHPNPLIRNSIKLLARFFARPVADSVRPITGWIDRPPAEPLSATDRGKPVDLSLKTLNPDDAARLATYTEDLLHSRTPR